MHLEYNVQKLLLNSLAPQPNESVTFINDFPRDSAAVNEGHRHRAQMTQLWYHEMEKLSKVIGFTMKPLILIDLRNAAPGSFDADGFVDGKEIDLIAEMDSWKATDIVIAITGPSITGELVRRLQPQQFRFASAPAVRVDFEGFKADYSLIPLRFAVLTDKLAIASAVDMIFRYESEVWKCRFDVRGQRFLFKENGAAHRPGEFINYPSGCANIQPYPGINDDVRGKSQTAGQIPAIINDELIVYTISENHIVSINGEGPAATSEREHILDPAHPEMAIITKLGLGVNDESRCNGTHVGDEKTMGMHWGYGPSKHFPDTIWAEHPIQMDMDFVYPDGSRESVFRNNQYTKNLGPFFLKY